MELGVQGELLVMPAAVEDAVVVAAAAVVAVAAAVAVAIVAS